MEDYLTILGIGHRYEDHPKHECPNHICIHYNQQNHSEDRLKFEIIIYDCGVFEPYDDDHDDASFKHAYVFSSDDDVIYEIYDDVYDLNAYQLRFKPNQVVLDLEHHH